MQSADEVRPSEPGAAEGARPVATDRREFLERVTAGAMTLAVASASVAVPFAAAYAATSQPGSTIRAPWSDAWLDKIKGKHKQFFDAVSPNEGFPLAFAGGFLNLNHEAYGLEDKDLTAVVGLRHTAMPLALPDEVWTKYKIGEAMQFKDKATGAIATRNPYLYANGTPLPGVDIPTLMKRGVVFTVCNVALTVISGICAKNAGVSKEDAKAEWTQKLLPGTTLVPIGVMAVNLAQERGCTYCYGG
jgi:intracellular sulfur oxidation DsrE/DsrF family protein